MNMDYEEEDSGKVEQILLIASAFVSLMVSLFFLSFNITGNAINSLNKTSSNVIGIVLFVLALAGFFIYSKKKIRKKK